MRTLERKRGKSAIQLTHAGSQLTGKPVLNAKEELSVQSDVSASSVSRTGSWAVLSGGGWERGVKSLGCAAKIKIMAQPMAALTSVGGTVCCGTEQSSPCSPFSVGQTVL